MLKYFFFLNLKNKRSFKDAITGLIVKTIQIQSTSGIQSINIADLPRGNYIIILEGDNTYLTSKHLMVY